MSTTQRRRLTLQRRRRPAATPIDQAASGGEANQTYTPFRDAPMPQRQKAALLMTSSSIIHSHSRPSAALQLSSILRAAPRPAASRLFGGSSGYPSPDSHRDFVLPPLSFIFHLSSTLIPHRASQKVQIFILLALTSLLPQLSTLKAQCTCNTDTSWQAAYDQANVILLGTCIDITPNTHKGGLNVVFNVDSSWKRAIEPTTTVHTNSPTQCGYPFLRGHRYLVFANKLHQTTATSICEPNQPAHEAVQALKTLGPGQPPGRTELASKMNLTLIALGVLGMLFLAFVVLRKRFMKA